MINLFEMGKRNIRETKPYQAGKPIEEVERELGLHGIIKLASNENPLGGSPKAIAAAKEALAQIHMYPDALYPTLRSQLAKYTGVAMEDITLGNGSENCLEILMKAYIEDGDNVIIDQYCFATIRILIQAYGGVEKLINSQNFRHDVMAMVESVDNKTKAIVIVNPNNPTGTYISEKELLYVLENIPQHVLVIIDEAYFEYVLMADYPNSVRLLAFYPNLVISRTFSKAFGLAGLRLGYLLSSYPVSRLLNRSRMPFNVNNCAVAAGIAALEDKDFLLQTRKVNLDGLAQVSNALIGLGIKYMPSVGNFIMIDIERDAIPVYNAILEQGIIVRPLLPYGLAEHLRITIGTEAQNCKLLTILEEICHA